MRARKRKADVATVSAGPAGGTARPGGRCGPGAPALLPRPFVGGGGVAMCGAGRGRGAVTARGPAGLKPGVGLSGALNCSPWP